MRFTDLIKSNLGLKTLAETDQFVAEMANFLSDVTDLPANIVLWTKPQPKELPHDKYRMKVFKDRVHVATFSISAKPEVLWQVGRGKYKLDAYEQQQAVKVIAEFATLFIQLVDGKLNNDQIKYEIKRLKGSK